MLVVPLSHSELSRHAAGLILNQIRHKVRAQLHVSPPIAPHVIVIGGREQSEDLGE